MKKKNKRTKEQILLRTLLKVEKYSFGYYTVNRKARRDSVLVFQAALPSYCKLLGG